MTARLAILCPGQGGQNGAMFDLVRADPGTMDTVQAWLRTAGGPVAQAPLADLLAHQPALFDNRIAQPLVVAASLAAWSVLAPRLPRPALVAGYSVGEISAAAVAGVFPLHETVAIAAHRAGLMSDAAAERGEQGLAVVSGLPEHALAALLAQTGCEPAIVLPSGTVVGGLRDQLAALHAQAPAAGAHTTPLPVNIASHTPLLQSALAPLRALFQRHAAAPALPLLAGISSAPVYDAAQAVDLLARQTVQPIQWRDCLDAIAESRIDVALELGPGNALARMLRERHPGIACRSVADFRSIDGVVAWVEAQVRDR